MKSPETLRSIIEAILFTAHEPVSVPQIEKLLEAECSPDEIRHHLRKLQEKYPATGGPRIEPAAVAAEPPAHGGENIAQDAPPFANPAVSPLMASGIVLAEVAGGWRLLSHEATEPWVKQFIQQNNIRRLSGAALEVLAIIAYRQPVTLAEINEIRGVESGGVIRLLLEKRIVRMTGRKNVVGKPILYGTGPEFLEHFGIASLEDLPSLSEFENLFGGEAKQALLFKEPGAEIRSEPGEEDPLDETQMDADEPDAEGPDAEDSVDSVDSENPPPAEPPGDSPAAE